MQAVIARFLRNIPQSNQPAKTIQEIAPGDDNALLLGFSLMLKTLGVVQINDQQQIRAASQTGKYVLHSLASYVESDLQLVDDWHTRGINRDGSNNPLQNGATLLYLLETRRLALLENPAPSRTEEVAQVLIKRTNPQTKQSELFFQFDANANQYQLIGGRRSDNDDGLLTTMIREIKEELANDIAYQRDYNLTCVIEDLAPPATLSPTFGALTEYHFAVYHMVDLSQNVQLQPNDEWVPVAHVLAGYVINGSGQQIPFNTAEIYRLMNDIIPGGLAGLPDSFRSASH